MKKTFYTNQALKYRNGAFTGSIDDGERKIIIDFSVENKGSLFVYNLYTRPHEVIRGIKQGKVSRLSKDVFFLHGYGFSSNGFPIDDLSSKVIIDETKTITSVEFIKSAADDISILYKSRENKCSSFFFELFKLQNTVLINDPVEFILHLNDILNIVPKDILKIKNDKNSLEFSIAGEYLTFLSTNPTITAEQHIYHKTCLTGFYMLHKCLEIHDNIQDRLFLIELVHKNVYPFLGLLIHKLFKSKYIEMNLPFKELPDLERAKRIYMLMECYVLYISNEHNNLEKWKFVMEDSRKLLDSNRLAPFNYANSQTEIEKIYSLLFNSIEETLINHSNA